MQVNIKIQPAGKNLSGAISKTVDVSEEQSLEAIAMIHAGEAPHRILLARVNGVYLELTNRLSGGDFNGDPVDIEFLDMRNHSADLVYQRGLCMIYLKVLHEFFADKGRPDVTAMINNSLNKGLFTTLISGDGESYPADNITSEDIAEIEKRMRDITAGDLRIKKEVVSRNQGIHFWNKKKFPERADLIEGIYDVEYRAKIYDLDGYQDYFFGPMVPSTGYIDKYELRKYQNGLLLRYPYYSDPETIPEYRDDKSMYEAFGSEQNWLNLLGTVYVRDINKVVTDGGAGNLILLSEALHEKKIAEIADEIARKKKRIILIAGPSSSGKTTFAKRLCVQLRVNGLEPLYLGTDDYFVERNQTPKDENGEYNYEDLDALDIELFNRNMNELLDGKEADLPEFDFISGTKIFGRRITRITASQPIVIEGIHALNGKLTHQIDKNEKYKIYVSPLVQLNIDRHNRIPSTDSRMLRRMVRDYKYRAHTAAMTIDEWPQVRAGEDKNIFPYNSEADMLYNSILPYEIGILKKYAVPLLENIRPEQPQYSEAVRILGMLKYFRTIEDESFVPNNSILREFIGGSVFTK